MKKITNDVLTIKKIAKALLLGAFVSSIFFAFFQNQKVQTQTELFPVGERLSYNVSFENFDNAAYAEISVVSRGRLEGFESVELYSKIKSIDLLSAAFYMFDEERTTFASIDTGLPLYVRKVSKDGVLPQESVENYLKMPTANFDLLTLIYKIRRSNGIGTFLFQENGKNYALTLQTVGTEQIRLDTGIFETSKITAQSEYLTDLGISDLTLNLSTDERKLPVLFRFSTAKGNFRAELASAQIFREKPAPGITPTPLPTPVPTRTPVPQPTPTPYVDNQPLIERLPFVLGETLEYKVSNGQADLGSVVAQVAERKQFLGKDSLQLKAFVKTPGTVVPPVFALNNLIVSQVDPVSLMPSLLELKLSGALAGYSQIVKFDQEKGIAVFNGVNTVEIPVGTHSILSLAYAVRSFNLKPSRDSENPVNDTRVAVFLGDQAYVFTLRPSDSEIINLKGEKIPAQLITIKTGISAIDQLNPRIWLGLDKNRLPLKISAGDYQADLVSVQNIPPK